MKKISIALLFLASCTINTHQNRFQEHEPEDPPIACIYSSDCPEGMHCYEFRALCEDPPYCGICGSGIEF